jgi:hypothetical protein
MNSRNAQSYITTPHTSPLLEQSFTEFLNLSVEKMASRRVEELKKLGINTNRPDISQYIERVKQSKLELLGKEAMEPIEIKIAHLKSQKK